MGTTPSDEAPKAQKLKSPAEQYSNRHHRSCVAEDTAKNVNHQRGGNISGKNNQNRMPFPE